MIAYNRLFAILEKKGLKKADLQKAISCSPNTISKLSKNEYISLQNIDEICQYLHCQPGDILECITQESDEERFLRYCEHLGIEPKKVLEAFMKQFVSGEFSVKSTSNGLKVEK